MFRKTYDKAEAGEALCPLGPSCSETHLLRPGPGVFPWQSPTKVLTPRGWCGLTRTILYPPSRASNATSHSSVPIPDAGWKGARRLPPWRHAGL